jgi:outer membrane protein assembly factor BamB
MNSTTSFRRIISVLVVALIAGMQPPSVFAQDKDAAKLSALNAAARIVQDSDAPGGICAVVGRSDAELALALGKAFTVHCLYTEPSVCDQMRKVIRSRGAYGTVSAGTFQRGRLPYADNLLNIVVVDPYPALARDGLSAAEVLRVLVPLGTAYLNISSTIAGSEAGVEESKTQMRTWGTFGVETVRMLSSVAEKDDLWMQVQKPWPAEIDEWTHYLHGPDGNPVARDRVVGPPQHYQWISDPQWQRCHETDSSISTLVTARGRLFFIEDQAPTSLTGPDSPPDKWFLVARDAFNGVLLWKVPIRQWGWREWKNTWFTARPGDFPLNIQKRLVAVGDKLYVTLGYQAPVSELDARSGQVLKTYDGTQRTGEILLHGGTLILSLREGKQVWVAAVDAASGKRLWTSPRAYRGSTVDYLKWKEAGGGTEPAELDPSLNMATDGHVVALLDGPEIVGLDFRSGAEKWRAAFPQDDADRAAGGIKSQGNLWIGTMIVRDGVVVHASPSRLAALSADTGKLLWTQPKKFIQHLWYEWKDVFVIGDLVWTWSAELEEGFFEGGPKGKQREFWPRSANGYDLHTGELKKAVPTGPIFQTHHHHRCYRNKATERYILASRRGTEYVDLIDGQHTVQNWVRGTCHVGMMPANGLQYAPPHPCQCYIEEKLNGLFALAPERSEERGARDEGPGARDESVQPPLLERGPAYTSTPNPQSPIPNPQSLIADPEDWPAFRHDSLRSGSVRTRVPDGAAVLWRVSAGRKVTAPSVVAGRLFVSLVDEHHVACLSAQDGSKLWEFAAGGRIDSPPTCHQGTVLFGSADGWVYCLRAADGQLAWRFRAAPQQRLIGAFGQLESAWPVHGSVLVQDGTVYFAAGRSSHLDGGIWMYGLDARTGQLRHQTKLEGPRYTVDNIQQNFQLPMGALPDILLADGAHIYMRSQAFDAELKPQRGRPDLQTKSGFLDDNYFKRTPWTLGSEYANLIAHDNQSACYVRMFDSLKGLDPTVFFTPGSKGYLLFAKNMQGKRDNWSQRVPVRIRAMVLAAGRLFVAGPPDVVDPSDPLGAFEGRKGGLLYTIDTASGERLAEHPLPSPPVFNGAAAAHGRLYVAEEDGSITCFGRP